MDGGKQNTNSPRDSVSRNWAAPCTSIFKPLWLDTPLPDLTGPAPTGTYDPQTLFWRHGRLHRAVLADYPTRSAVLTAECDALEQEFVAGRTEAKHDFTERDDAFHRFLPLKERICRMRSTATGLLLE